MSDTPKTDAAFKDANAEGRSVAYGFGYMTEFSRQLERENATLVKTLLLIASKEAVKPDVAAATILRELGEMS